MKLGTVGSGMIVNRFLDAVSKVDGIECYAVYSRSQDKANELAEKFDVKKTYTDFGAMLQDPEIDVVYVASPNSLHFEQSKAAILAHKNVFCEKPLTSTIEELEELLALAKENNVFFFEAITAIHLPNFQLLKDNLAQVGGVKMVFANFLQYSSKMDLFKDGGLPNVFNPKFSGGALMDLNIYNLHMVMGLFGKPVSAAYYPHQADNGIDLSGSLVLTYPDFIAVCSAAKNVQAKNYATIYGEDGFIYINSEVSMINNFDVVKETTQNYTVQDEENVMVYELMNFIKIINDNDHEQYKLLNEHSLSVYRVLHQARIEAGVFFAADKE